MTDPTGASYDRVAERYAETIGDELDHRPLERGLLDAFASLLGPDARVADIGCGPGHVTAYLADPAGRPGVPLPRPGRRNRVAGCRRLARGRSAGARTR